MRALGKMTSNDPPIQQLLPPRPPRTESLAGSVQYHTSYLLLHSHESPSTWPSAFTSPLYKDLLLRLQRVDGLVNFVWLGGDSADSDKIEEDAYSVTLWRRFPHEALPQRFEIPLISSKNVDTTVDSSNSLGTRGELSSGPYFYICAHGSRDCRCGVRGGNLVKDLAKELENRGMLYDSDGRPRIGEVGHVGGHK